MSKRIDNLMKNSVVFMIGNFASKILIFLLLPLYTNVLNPDEYGEVDIYINLLAVLFSIVSLQAGESVFRFIVDAKDEQEKTSVISNAFVIALFGIAAFSVGMFIFGQVTNFKYTLVFILYVAFNIFSVFCQQTIRGLNYTTLYSTVGVLATIVQILGNIIFIFICKMGAASLLWAHVITFIFVFICILVKCRLFRYFKIEAVKLDILKEHLKFNLPLLPNALCIWGVSSLGRYLLLFFYSTSEVGLFAFATKFSQFLIAINSVIFFAWQQSALSEYNSEDKNEYATDIFNKFISLELGAISMMIPCVKFLIFTVMGEQYRLAWTYVPIFFFGALLTFCGDFVSIGFFGAKKTNTVFFASLASLLVYFFVGYFGVKYWYIWGVGIAYVLSKIVYYIVLQVRVKKYLYAKPKLNKIAIPSIMVAGSMVTYYLVDSFYCLLGLTVFFGVLTIVTNLEFIKEMLSILFGKFSKKKN